MKAIIYNTGFDIEQIKSEEKLVVDLELAQELSEKWGGMIKVLPYEEPEKVEEPKKVAKESIIKKTIKKLKK